MAKKFDIYITGGAKDYDIRLNHRKTVYDIIIHALPYHYNENAKNGILLSSHACDTLVHKFLSTNRTSATKLCSNPIAGQLMKHEKASGIANMASKARESIVKFSSPAQSTMLVSAKLDTTGKRKRMLYEMDTDTLTAFDDMTLNAVDFIILP